MGRDGKVFVCWSLVKYILHRGRDGYPYCSGSRRGRRGIRTSTSTRSTSRGAVGFHLIRQCEGGFCVCVTACKRIAANLSPTKAHNGAAAGHTLPPIAAAAHIIRLRMVQHTGNSRWSSLLLLVVVVLREERLRGRAKGSTCIFCSGIHCSSKSSIGINSSGGRVCEETKRSKSSKWGSGRGEIQYVSILLQAAARAHQASTGTIHTATVSYC
mmetsp:Transcript_45797/g.93734  ORF Transcript_45797/g.93734 Transcript_45797/m.93734 type:complete len:213 (-) Transcript_45797:174-812(-)